MTSQIEITETVARDVLRIVDAGLVRGVGNPAAGGMCVEAAVCFALGLPHGDDPACVSRALRALKINLNDRDWSSNAARAKGLRRLAVAQLGSRDHLDDVEFAKRVSQLAIRKSVPEALRAVASIHKDPAHVKALRAAADKCEQEPTEANARAAYAVAYATHSAAYAASAAAYAADSADSADSAADSAAYAAASAYSAASVANAARSAARSAAYAANAARSAAARDKSLADFAEGVVQILIEMQAPGCVWLPLTEAA